MISIESHGNELVHLTKIGDFIRLKWVQLQGTS